jgi:hypothetical protein
MKKFSQVINGVLAKVGELSHIRECQSDKPTHLFLMTV